MLGRERSDTMQLALPTSTVLSPAELAALEALRLRYQQTGDVFSEHELAYLRFVRWCYATGLLVP